MHNSKKVNGCRQRRQAKHQRVAHVRSTRRGTGRQCCGCHQQKPIPWNAKETVGSQARRSEGAVHVIWPSVRSSPACSASVSDKNHGGCPVGSGGTRKPREIALSVAQPTQDIADTMKSKLTSPICKPRAHIRYTILRDAAPVVVSQACCALRPPFRLCLRCAQWRLSRRPWRHLAGLAHIR